MTNRELSNEESSSKSRLFVLAWL